MNLSFDSALDPFFDATAKITGTRRESGAARALELTAPCCVLEGEPGQSVTGALAPTYERLYTVLVRRADWPDHLPPQTGDAVSVASYPSLAVRQVTQNGPALWQLACVSTEKQT